MVKPFPIYFPINHRRREVIEELNRILDNIIELEENLITFNNELRNRENNEKTIEEKEILEDLRNDIRITRNQLTEMRRYRNDIQQQLNENPELQQLLLETQDPALQQGEGVLLRDPGKLPPSVRNLLNKIGSEKVESIKLIRTPLSKSTEILLNIASFGQLDKKMKELGVDKFFHLSSLINGKYELEKNEVIKFRINPNAVKSDSETLDIPINKDITIQELMDNTKKQMGDEKFTSYEAKSNNCSVFLSNILSANGLSNSNSETFINQKTEELFNSFPSLSKYIVDLGTTAGAVAERQIEGEGKSYFYNFGLPHCKIRF